MTVFTLKWGVDKRGYRIERRAPVTTGAMIGRHDGYDCLVRNGGSLVEYEPFKFKLDGVDGLWRRLAKTTKTPQGALDFVSTYGFLQQKDAKEETVADIKDAIETARILSALYDKNDWVKVADWLNEAGRDSMFGLGGIGRLGVVFHGEQGAARPGLKFRPGSLRSAILVQYLDDMSGGAKLRECIRPGCPEWFKFGPGTGRRETARYCSPKCQQAHAYMKRKESHQ